MDTLARPIAVRSLACEDHAHNIPPRVLSIEWFVGRRCNYDCSYCSPHVHDAVSPWLDVDLARDMISRLHDHCQQQSTSSRWVLTGGEPFIDPGFLPVLQHLRHHSTVMQVNTTTNGSLPTDVYVAAAHCLTSLTFSLHFERSSTELQHVIDAMLAVRDRTSCSVTATVMLLPGTLDQCQAMCHRLSGLTLPFVVRKITPPAQDPALSPFQQKVNNRKDQLLVDTSTQAQHKIQWIQQTDQHRSQAMDHYYSPREIEWLQQINPGVPWHNMGVWYSDGSYREVNSDHIISQDHNSFRGWTCWAGVDNIYVDHDGRIYRGYCMEGGALGHVSDPDLFAKSPTECSRQWCSCNFDLPVRKHSPGHGDLVRGAQDL